MRHFGGLPAVRRGLGIAAALAALTLGPIVPASAAPIDDRGMAKAADDLIQLFTGSPPSNAPSTANHDNHGPSRNNGSKGKRVSHNASKPRTVAHINTNSGGGEHKNGGTAASGSPQPPASTPAPVAPPVQQQPVTTYVAPPVVKHVVAKVSHHTSKPASESGDDWLKQSGPQGP